MEGAAALIHVSLVSSNGGALLVLDPMPSGFGYQKEGRCPLCCAGADGAVGCCEDAHACSGTETGMPGLCVLFLPVWKLNMPASCLLAGVTILHPIKLVAKLPLTLMCCKIRL